VYNGQSVPEGLLGMDRMVTFASGNKLVPRAVKFPNLQMGRSGKDRGEMRVMIQSEFNSNHHELFMTKRYHNGITIEKLVQHFAETVREMGGFLPESEEAALAGNFDTDMAYIPSEMNNSNFNERFSQHLVGSSIGDGRFNRLRISESHDICIGEVPLIQRFTLGMPENLVLSFTQDHGATAGGPLIVQADGHSSVHRYFDVNVDHAKQLAAYAIYGMLYASVWLCVYVTNAWYVCSLSEIIQVREPQRQ
jgi:hypothetical protein